MSRCDNDCLTSSFEKIYKCDTCNKNICYRCLGHRQGHHFAIKYYCKSCFILRIDKND